MNSPRLENPAGGTFENMSKIEQMSKIEEIRALLIEQIEAIRKINNLLSEMISNNEEAK